MSYISSSCCLVLTTNRKDQDFNSLFYGLTSWDDSPSAHKTPPRSEPSTTSRTSSAVNTSSQYLRKVSSMDNPSVTTKIAESTLWQRKRRDSTTMTVPRAPILQPLRLPSLAETSKSSWRLSFSIQNRGEHLRKLSQGGLARPLTDVSTPPTDPQSLSKWLYSQGLRSPSRAIASSEDSTALGSLALDMEMCSASQDLGGVDGGKDPTQTAHLHEMRISQRLASSGDQDSSSSPRLSRSGSNSHQHGLSSTSSDSRGTYNSRLKNFCNISDSLPMLGCIPNPGGHVPEDGSSSFYPSGGNSIQASPRSSRIDLLSSLVSIKSNSDLDGKKHCCVSNSFQKLTDSATAMQTISDESPLMLSATNSLPSTPYTAGLLSPLVQCRHRSFADGSSIEASETESYHQREMELSVVKTRFIDSKAQGSPGTPRSSKFREEFQAKISSLETCTPDKRSAFLKWPKLGIKSYDGQMERMLGVPLPPDTLGPPEGTSRSRAVSTASRSSRGSSYLSPLSDREAAEVWGNAIYLNTRLNSLGKSSKLSSLNGLKTGRRSGNSKDISHESDGVIPVQGRKEGKKNVTEYDRLLAKEVEVLQDWEHEMAKTAQKAKDKSRQIVPGAKLIPDRRYPVSWSRFSSFDRAERIMSAGPSDGVAAKDFAIHAMKDRKSVWYHNEAKYHLYHLEVDGHEFHKKEKQEGILSRLGATFIETLKDTVADSAVYEIARMDQARGHRGSLTLEGKLEYPELEILPIEMMSERELEQKVEEELEEDELDKKVEELDAILGFSKAAAKKVTPARSTSDETRPGDKSSMANETPKNFVEVAEDDLNAILSKASHKVEESLWKLQKATGIIPEKPNGRLQPREFIDAVGMNAEALNQQIAAGVELKKKMDTARKAGVRRGPVARRKAKNPDHSDTGNAFLDGGESSTDDEYGAHGTDDIRHTGADNPGLRIADLKPYNACIVHQKDEKYTECERAADADSRWTRRTTKQTFGTWCGRHSNINKSTSRAKSPRRAFGSRDALLRKSTEF